MSIRVACPSCRQKYSVSATRLKRAITCQKCGFEFKGKIENNPEIETEVHSRTPPSIQSSQRSQKKEQPAKRKPVGEKPSDQHDKPRSWRAVQMYFGGSFFAIAMCLILVWFVFLRGGNPVLDNDNHQKTNSDLADQNTIKDETEIPSDENVLAKSSSSNDKIKALDDELKKLRAELASSKNDLPSMIARVEASVVSIRNGQFGGSGFLINSSGCILTNYHVIEGATDIEVTFRDGVSKQAIGYLVYNEDVDLAVIKVDLDVERPHLNLNLSLPKKGEDVVAIGDPKGLTSSVSKGVVSGIRDQSELRGASGQWLQIDAAINPGNSGGPLIDMNGMVVGINSFKLSKSEGLNFAVSAMEAAKLIALIQKDAFGWEVSNNFRSLPRNKVAKKTSATPKKTAAKDLSDSLDKIAAEAKKRREFEAKQAEAKRLFAEKELKAKNDNAEKIRQAEVRQAELNRILSEIQSTRLLLKKVMDQMASIQSSRNQMLLEAKKLDQQAAFWQNEINKGHARIRNINDVLAIRAINNDDGTTYRPGRNETKNSVQLRAERSTIQNLQSRASFLIQGLRQQYNTLDAQSRLELGQLNQLGSQKVNLENRIYQLENLN